MSGRRTKYATVVRAAVLSLLAYARIASAHIILPLDVMTTDREHYSVYVLIPDSHAVYTYERTSQFERMLKTKLSDLQLSVRLTQDIKDSIASEERRYLMNAAKLPSHLIAASGAPSVNTAYILITDFRKANAPRFLQTIESPTSSTPVSAQTSLDRFGIDSKQPLHRGAIGVIENMIYREDQLRFAKIAREVANATDLNRKSCMQAERMPMRALAFEEFYLQAHSADIETQLKKFGIKFFGYAPHWRLDQSSYYENPSEILGVAFGSVKQKVYAAPQTVPLVARILVDHKLPTNSPTTPSCRAVVSPH